MGQDPNQPYSGPYGQPQPGAVPPQGGYQGGYQQSAYPPPNTGYPPPNPGYQYQQPYGQPQGQLYNTAHPLGPTTLNMEPNTAAGLSYLTWVAGLIIFLMEKQNRFVRFHAMQEILLTGLAVIVWFVLFIVGFALAFTVLGCVILPLELLLYAALFVLWLICLINAFQGKYFKLPVIGNLAERWANPGPATPAM